MKWYKFSEKLPELGTNILVAHEEAKLIGICEFNLEARKAILNDNPGEYQEQEYFSDDASEIHVYDLRGSDYWSYPSSVKLSKKNL